MSPNHHLPITKTAARAGIADDLQAGPANLRPAPGRIDRMPRSVVVERRLTNRALAAWQRSQERISAMNLQMTYSDPSIAERKRAAQRRAAKETDDADRLIDR
jgi:hypothetical protein